MISPKNIIKPLINIRNETFDLIRKETLPDEITKVAAREIRCNLREGIQSSKIVGIDT